MTNKDWREQFNEKFVKQGIPIGIAKYEAKDGLDITPSKIISFIESLLKSKQEEMEGEMEKLRKPLLKNDPKYFIDGKEMRLMGESDASKYWKDYASERYNQALDELKPIISNILNEDKFASQGCKFCYCGKRSEAKGTQGGNGACNCSCHLTWNL